MARLESQDTLKRILQSYFQNLRSPLAWCTSAGPAEILRALGFDVYFPENHGALLGASRAAQRYIPRAHQAGYAAEVCSYLTADIGAWLMQETPLTGAYGLPSIPRPDLIVFNTNQCREVAEWFNYFGRVFQCPVVGIFPPRHLEEVTPADAGHVVSQFLKLIATGEEIIGRKLDPSCLEETVRQSKEGSARWKKLLQTARNRPAPISFFDGTILMAPIVVLRGTSVCTDFYEQALAEVTALQAQPRAAVPEERVRLYWEGMPIWGRLRALADFFAANGAAVVASTYCNSWVFDDFDPRNPLESMAYAYTKIFINRGEDTKLAMLSAALQEYQIDGVIFHDAKTCFNNSNNRFGLARRLQETTHVDTVTIDGDLNDLRFFSEGQSRTKLETFIEQLYSRRRLHG
jgi:benzoyl-CoA reductase/2-hydroxyglutaryl-CoA dehydratase subunit BcrC/BadD/HgdB